MQADQQALDELVQRIVEAVHPLKIILFGSAARGEMGPHSDIDLLVVMPEGTHRSDTMGYIYSTVRGLMIPFDVVVTTPGDLEKYGDRPGLIYKTVLREGRTVYAA
jgi:predicted nucleotidyltransferase